MGRGGAGWQVGGGEAARGKGWVGRGRRCVCFRWGLRAVALQGSLKRCSRGVRGNCQDGFMEGVVGREGGDWGATTDVRGQTVCVRVHQEVMDAAQADGRKGGKRGQ